MSKQGCAKIGVLLDKTGNLMSVFKAIVLTNSVAVEALEVVNSLFLCSFDRRGFEHGTDPCLDLV